jgi:cell division protein FtsW
VVAGLLFLLVGYNDFGTMACLAILFVAMLWVAGQLRIFAGMAVIALAGSRC